MIELIIFCVYVVVDLVIVERYILFSNYLTLMSHLFYEFEISQRKLPYLCLLRKCKIGKFIPPWDFFSLISQH